MGLGYSENSDRFFAMDDPYLPRQYTSTVEAISFGPLQAHRSDHHHTRCI